jgi:hypothetical protein
LSGNGITRYTDLPGDSDPSARRDPAWRPKGVLAGVLLGVLAVLASGLLSRAGAPPAYGICVACHSRDLLAGLGLQRWLGAPAVDGLVLTTLGLLAGAALAARVHGERRVRPARSPVRSLLMGALTMCASLLALGCTTRLALRVAYGDPLAMWSFGGVLLAAAAVTGGMVWYARRPGAGGDVGC